MSDPISLVTDPLTLPNGIRLPNRLVKAAMAEGIGLGGGPPQPNHLRLYEQWAQGGWGMIISGNVQIDPKHLASPHDLTITPSTIDRIAYRRLASAVASSNPEPPLLIMQISHPGLQSSSTINFSRLPHEPAIGPCSARPDMNGGIMGWLWGHAVWPRKSREIRDPEDWLSIVDKFVAGAVLAEEAGWDGVQVHAAHGYLLAEYLSPLTNPNPMQLPDVPDSIPVRLHLLYLILEGISRKTSKSFIKAVKVNCSDFVQGGLDEDQASELIKTIVSWQLLDIIEISGGTYAQPAFAYPETLSSPSKRQSLFSHFTTSLLPLLPPPPQGPAILLTGGLHNRELIASSLAERACDIVGIGRPACIIPDLPRRIILNRAVADDEAFFGTCTIPHATTVKFLLGGPPTAKGKGIPLVGAGVSTLWHTWQMCRIGRGVEPDEKMSWFRGLMVEEIWEGMIVRGVTLMLSWRGNV
ncbi:NADH:flavin oxidoreductase/NADH oxidase [Cryptococcus deuterogattii R265]|uniref:NADH:flavin oxidoreductase/NADH oxidase n=1 Tax=Cryptococcus deuterogattii (strain R265) TaxID=294750 RepID=UPI001937EA7D|nr:NADH:flavin oxidoreductase/NADH oxidase [Cryptococcus deuterogattii R265]